MKPTLQQKIALARSLSLEMWNELCTGEAFTRALASNYELACQYAERFALAADRRAEMASWAKST